MGTTINLGLPDWAELDTVAGRIEPPALWPVGTQPLLAHWMDYARRHGADQIRIYCADRPHLVRDWLEGGAFWSCRVEVIPAPLHRFPPDIEWVDRVPGEKPIEPPADGAGLVRWWFERNMAWLLSRDTHALLLDERHPSGGWVGPRARIHKSANLTPPFWIGADTEVGPAAAVGPGAVIGPRSVIEAKSEIRQSVVLPETIIGRHVGLDHMIVDGNIVIHAERGCRVEIPDTFIVAPTAGRRRRVSWKERLLALALWGPGMLLALGRPEGPVRTVVTPRGHIDLRERLSGPLLARRASWLPHVIAGRLSLAGPLPRPESAFAVLPADAANLLRTIPPGVFSIADVHGCHCLEAEEESTHALFAAARPDSAAMVLKALPRLLWRVPA
ncbi:MAG: hypothetical protein D6781_02145 [Verrucomicrobia bacterium]|nr:MAG: hypothetical protein D6781_02145 [Verrucomicrobiota bacterium]